MANGIENGTDSIPKEVHPEKGVPISSRLRSAKSSTIAEKGTIMKKIAKPQKLKPKEKEEDSESNNTEILEEDNHSPKQTDEKKLTKKKQATLKISAQSTVISSKNLENKMDTLNKKPKTLLNKIFTNLNQINFDSQSKSSRNKLWNFKITCWNVDGLRACIKKNGLEFLEKELPDILCLQEIKSESHKIPDLNSEGELLKDYHIHWNPAKKAGYSGTGLISKIKPRDVKYGIGKHEHDNEGRVITAEYDQFYLVNVYIPNSGNKLVRLEYRLEWDRCFRNYLTDLDAKKPVIICGDLNVAHNEIDLRNPKTNTKSAGFTKEERDSFGELLRCGFVDTFRHFYPDMEGQYTYWSYMFSARIKNIGWRIDYFIVSERLLPRICDSIIRKEVFGSDHCPITLLLELD
ncbi:exodeoxyribonuclease-like isoform X2 [Gordionus sp. m RMFG-2023]